MFREGAGGTGECLAKQRVSDCSRTNMNIVWSVVMLASSRKSASKI